MSPSSANAEPKTLRIVAVGDSYTAGNGAGNYEDTDCFRSKDNWSSLYAQGRVSRGQTVLYDNAACSGSTISALVNGTNWNPATGSYSASKGGIQISHLGTRTDMVLMTFGGNDAGFATIVSDCLVKILPNYCNTALNRAERLTSDGTISNSLAEAVRRIRQATRTDTQIVIMGYPPLVAPNCLGVLPGVQVAHRIRKLSDKADEIQQAVVDAAARSNPNIKFIPVSGTFKWHAPGNALPAPTCSVNPVTWVNQFPALDTSKVPTWYHPNSDGQREYARLLTEAFPSWTPASWAGAGGGGSVGTPTPANKVPSAAFSSVRVDGVPGKVNLDASASSDPDGSIARYEWLYKGAVVATGKTASYAFGTADRAPSVTLRVTDDKGAAATTVKTLSLPNRAPVIGRPNPADGTIVGTNRPVLSTTVTDPDGDAVGFTYRITGYMVDKSSGPVSGGWTVPASTLDPGTKYDWTVTVTDGQGGSASAGRSLTVAMLPTAADVIATPSGKGYWQVASDGGVFTYGDAQFYGSVPGIPLHLTNIMGMARTPSGKGYWVVGSDGGVFSFGDAGFYGSLPGIGVHVGNIVDMVPTKTGRGYWLVGSDGGVFSFGDAQFFGSMGGQPLNRPVVGMAATASGNGYWLVAADGGVFSFGDAPFYGSMGGQPLSYPVVDMDVTPDGGGYWMTAEDGGVFTFGNAQFYGSMGGKPLNGRVTGMAVTPTGRGYWLNACDGGVFTFGDAPFLGSNPTYMCRGTNQG
ncbi:GDSL-type esterase/lipase family protein [Kineococcus rhizosphaerae]